VVRDVTLGAVAAVSRERGAVRRQLRGLYQYPIKSCRGTALEEAVVGVRGIVADRHWMVVDSSGTFLSQRELPRMALISPRLTGGTMEISAPGMRSLTISLGDDGPRVDVTVWADRCVAVDEGDSAAAWFTAFLGVTCRLTRMPDEEARRVDPAYASPDDQVGFADGFSFLLTSRASLEELNRRMPAPLPMNRFRPNIVIDGVEPFEEDGWKRIRIDGIEFTVAKPCARCAITTTDQNTAERSKEPLRTLATFRNVKGKGVMFGQNLIHDRTGVLHVGAEVEVLE
jgi:uncharacterized protein YcbX